MILLASERTVEVEGVKFTIRPEEYQDLFVVSDRAGKMASDMGIEDERYNQLIAVNLSLVNRITAWDGIGAQDGSPAPCTYENKLALFAQRRDLIGKIFQALSDQEAEDRKNSDPSPGGSADETLT